MKRGYTAAEYVEITRKLRELRPDISIATDFIVGFPGETEEDFQKRKLASTPASPSSTARVPARPPPVFPTTRPMT